MNAVMPTGFPTTPKCTQTAPQAYDGGSIPFTRSNLINNLIYSTSRQWGPYGIHTENA